jgi:hypothetical protein
MNMNCATLHNPTGLSLDAECIVIVGDYIGGVISVSLMHLA